MHKPLLLAAGQAAAGLREPGLHLVPEPGAGQALLDQGCPVGLAARRQAAEAEARQHVVGDRHRRERVGLLEDHADPAAGVGGPLVGVVDVDLGLADQEHLAGQAGAGHQLVHPVEDAQERRLAAAGRPDQRGDGTGGHLEVDPLEHLVGTEPGAHLDGAQPRGRARWGAVAIGSGPATSSGSSGSVWSRTSVVIQNPSGPSRSGQRLAQSTGRAGGAGGRRVNAERGGGERRCSGGAGGELAQLEPYLAVDQHRHVGHDAGAVELRGGQGDLAVDDLGGHAGLELLLSRSRTPFRCLLRSAA